MGSSARTLDINFRATGVEAVRSGIRLVRSEARAAATETAGLNETAVYGLGEVSRGITNLGMAGHVTSMSVRELSGGVMRLGSLLGPGAGLAGIAVMAGGLILEVFQKMRSGMSDTEKSFGESIARMANAGQSAELQKKYRDLYFGTPYDEKGQLRSPSATPGAFQGSLVDLRNRMAYAQSQLLPSGYLANDVANQRILASMRELKPQLDAMEAQARQIKTAIDVIQSQPASMGILPMKITASRPLTDGQIEKNARKYLDAVMTMIAKQHTGVQFAESPDSRVAAFEYNEKKLVDLLKKYNPGVDHSGIRKAYEESMKTLWDGVHVKALPLPPPSAVDRQIEDFAKQVQTPLTKIIGDGFATTIGSAISEGITQGFEAHSIGEAFKGAGRAILAGLGGILEQMGGVWMQYGILMTGLGEALWNPLTSGPAAIAIGAALIGLGAALGAVAHGSGGRSSSSAVTSMPALVTSGFVNGSSPATRGAGVTPQQSVTQHITIIGNDPASWRQIQEQLDRNAKLSAA